MRRAGRVRSKLAEMLAARLATEGLEVRVDPENLWPAEGYWRSSPRADCHRWDGHFQIRNPPAVLPASGSGEWRTASVGSYHTMTECLKGFSLTWESGWWLEVYCE